MTTPTDRLERAKQKEKERIEDMVHTAVIVRHGEKLIIPEPMPYDAAIKVIQRQMADEEQLIQIKEDIDCFPWEGAIAFKKAIEIAFGFGGTISTPSFFGPIPPQEIAIETGVDTKVSAPWGRFSFALGTENEWLSTGTGERDGRTIFSIGGVVKKKWKATIMQLADITRKLVREGSIYRGQALRIAFTDEDGETVEIPTPRFIDLRTVKLDELVYTQELTDLIETNIMTPLKYTDAVRQSGIPLKRGVLAAGQYGTGKSLLARAIAKVAVENKWTFLYIKDASELSHAIKFAALYQPAVIFAEDVDRFMAGGRTAEMDQILNTLDGIDSKTAEIMVILTTNHLEHINKAMLRPGRLDVVLNIVPPDAEAVQRLIRVYGRQSIDPKADLTEVGAILGGYTPAIIREVVERSKLAAVTRTGKANSLVKAIDIEIAAKTMKQQQDLLTPVPDIKPHWAGGMVEEVAEQVHGKLTGNGLGRMQTQVGLTETTVKKIAAAMGVR